MIYKGICKDSYWSYLLIYSYSAYVVKLNIKPLNRDHINLH